VSALDTAGYRYAYTSCPHVDRVHPALTLERQLLWEGSSIDADGRFSPPVFNCQIQARWPFARRCGRRHGSHARRAGDALQRAAGMPHVQPDRVRPSQERG
jgi:hypothetical protein